MVAPKTTYPSITDAEAQRLLDSIDAMTRAEQMTDAELSDAAIHAVCCLSQTPHYPVLDEMIKRFDLKSGIKRDAETGEVVL